ncbi:hypothetical protein, partial [Salmonella sp. s60131]|uniref:hypothetical protein n=1 Tax=Salmonella sp. s60131 TaxID=3159722 RepID=UPI003980D2FD
MNLQKIEQTRKEIITTSNPLFVIDNSLNNSDIPIICNIENLFDNNLNNLDKPVNIPLICNTENQRELRILTLLNIKGIEIQLLAFIDTG